jgi:hypothetical protein
MMRKGLGIEKERKVLLLNYFKKGLRKGGLECHGER